MRVLSCLIIWKRLVRRRTTIAKNDDRFDSVGGRWLRPALRVHGTFGPSAAPALPIEGGNLRDSQAGKRREAPLRRTRHS